MTCGQLAGSRPRLPSLGGERSGCAGIAPLERRPLGVERCPQSFPGCWAGWPWSRAPPAGLHLSQSDRPAAPVWGAAADLAPATTWPLPQPAGVGAAGPCVAFQAPRDAAASSWSSEGAHAHAVLTPAGGYGHSAGIPGSLDPGEEAKGSTNPQHPETGRHGTKVSRFRPTGSLRRDLACVIFFFLCRRRSEGEGRVRTDVHVVTALLGAGGRVSVHTHARRTPCGRGS